MSSPCNGQPELCTRTQITVPAYSIVANPGQPEANTQHHDRSVNEVLAEIRASIQEIPCHPELQEVEFFEKVVELCDYLSEDDRQSVMCCMGVAFSEAYETPGALGVLWLNAQEVADHSTDRQMCQRGCAVAGKCRP